VTPVESHALNEAARAQVDRILQSQGFRSAGVLRHLLNYLADKCLAGEGDTLKEYTIGLDALGKPASFDPRQESVVRMHMARLRQKLTEYYRLEGLEDTIVVDLPKGGFRLTFEPRRVVPVQPETSRETNKWTRRESILAAVLIVAVLGIGLTAAVLHKPETQAPGWTPELKELWEPLLSSNRRLVVCISTPLFVHVPGFGALRDLSLNDWDNASSSKSLSSVEKALGAGMSEPSYDFTDTGTASGAFLLGQFLAPRKENVTIMSASRISWHEIAEDNVVFLGSPEGIHQMEDIPSDVHLVLEPKGVRNVDPRPGEPSFIADAPGRDGEESGLSHALISRLPAMNGHGAILMLSGNEMAAVLGGVQAFTNPVLARTLVSRLKAANGKMPAYFQMVLNVKSMDQVPVEVTYSLHRELSAPK
jgi:hypothetical protein